MPYDMTDRERLEAYPKKGTKAAITAKAKRKGKKLTAYVNELLEKAAKP